MVDDLSLQVKHRADIVTTIQLHGAVRPGQAMVALYATECRSRDIWRDQDRTVALQEWAPYNVNCSGGGDKEFSAQWLDSRDNRRGTAWCL